MSVFAGQPEHTTPAPPLVSVDDFHELFQITTPSDADNARIETAIEIASGILRGGRRLFTAVNDDQLILDGSASEILLIPKKYLPLRGVGAVNDDGTDLVAGDDYEWSEKGIIRRVGSCRRWTSKFRGVTITCDHGYQPLPDEIAGVVLAVAKRWYDSPSGQGNVQSEQIGAYSVTYGKSGVGLTELEAQILERY